MKKHFHLLLSFLALLAGLLFVSAALKHDNPFFMLLAFLWFFQGVLRAIRYFCRKYEEEEPDDVGVLHWVIRHFYNKWNKRHTPPDYLE